MDVLTAVKRSRFVFPLACAAALAMVVISEGSYWRSVGTLDALGGMATTRASIMALGQSILDAESGQRGYLLSERKEYLQPYDKALADIEDALTRLDRYYGERPEQREILGRLHALTETKLSELAETIRLHDEGKVDAATELMLTDIGKEKMEAIRALGAELFATETANVALGRNDLYDTLLLSRIGITGLTLLSLLGLFLYLRQSSALVEQQAELKRIVQVERDRLEVEVAQRTAELTELTQHLQTAREDERSRLARDLHDELGALLTSAKLDAARIKSRLAGTAPEALERLGHLVETLNSGIALKRRIIEDLRPSALSNLGLVATLEILAREFADQSGVEVHCALAPVKLEATAELVVYRLVQEALTNIGKYAQAEHVEIGLVAHADRIEISVRDDGAGFDANLHRSSAHGLVGMRFRVEAEGGSFSLRSAPGQGTSIVVTLPAPALAEA